MKYETVRDWVGLARDRLVRGVVWGSLVGGLLGVAACSSSHSQASARDEVTTARCNWEQGCGNIGAGKTYTSMDNCLVQIRANWDTLWPATSCDGKINEAHLRLCLDSIPLVECGNGVDSAASLLTNCSSAKVCSGP